MENNTKSNIIQFPTREVAPANNIEATYVAGSEETYGQFIITRSMSTKFDQPIVRIAKLLKTGRVKVVSNYRYPTFERAEDAVTNFIQYHEARKASREAEAKAKKEFKHTLKVGDILYSSWGYGQTNVDFYQVVKTSAKSVWFKAIRSVREENGYMSGDATPIKDSFVDEDAKPDCRTVRQGDYVSFNDRSLSKVDEGRSYYYSYYH